MGVSGLRPAEGVGHLMPDADLSGGVWDGLYSRGERDADSRRALMAWWRRWEASPSGLWVATRTRLLSRLSVEDSRLVPRLGAVAALACLCGGLLSVMAAGMGPAAWLACLPWVAAGTATGIGLAVFWDAYRDSPERAADWLSSRPGMATWRQAQDEMGARAVVRDVIPAVLPRMLGEARRRSSLGRAVRWPMPWDAAWLAGEAWDMGVWLSSERHVYVLGPTRSGKTVCVVVPAVVEAPGFCLATSTRADVIRATRAWRERGAVDRASGARYGGRGRTWVFDPEGVGAGSPDTRHDLAWTPLAGCDDPGVARRRAETLVGVGGLGEGSRNAEWGVSAGGYVQALLYAAAVADLPLRKCYEWSLSPERAQEAADLIRRLTPDSRMGQWAATLEALPYVDPRQRGSEWFGVKNAFQVLSDPNVLASMDFGPHDPRLCAPADMVSRGDTVYAMCRPKRSGGIAGNAGVFTSLLLDTFQEACQGLALGAGAGPRGRIEPPARFVLDELSGIARWDGLRNAVTQGGGNGYQVVLVQQDRAAMVEDYGRECERTVWDNCHRMMLKGVTDDDTLRFFVSQVGRHRETRRDSSWSPGHGAFGGVSERVERDDSVDAHELSMLPRGTAVIQPLGCRPVLARTLHFTRRGWYSPDGPREGGGR